MNNIRCPICATPLEIRIAHGRKSNKAFLMLICQKDGRHLRGFISDQDYVSKVIGSQLPSKKIRS